MVFIRENHEITAGGFGHRRNVASESGARNFRIPCGGGWLVTVRQLLSKEIGQRHQNERL